jgi:hypothetical protein
VVKIIGYLEFLVKFPSNIMAKHEPGATLTSETKIAGSRDFHVKV